MLASDSLRPGPWRSGDVPAPRFAHSGIERAAKGRGLKSDVNTTHLTWSATTCEFPGAGVYIGLAPTFEHALLRQRLSEKQVCCYTGGTMRIRPDAECWRLNYFAVRDPSCVTVKPLNLPPLANGFRHVMLLFRLSSMTASNGLRHPALPDGANPLRGAPGTSGFVVTVGLSAAREEAFHRRAVAEHPETDWGEMFRRLAELGCRAAL